MRRVAIVVGVVLVPGVCAALAVGLMPVSRASVVPRSLDAQLRQLTARVSRELTRAPRLSAPLLPHAFVAPELNPGATVCFVAAAGGRCSLSPCIVYTAPAPAVLSTGGAVVNRAGRTCTHLPKAVPISSTG